MIVVQRHSCQRCHSPCPSICLTLSVVSIAAKSVERITYDSWVLKNSQERKKSRPSGFGHHPLLFLCVFFFGFLCHFSVQRGGEFLFPMECPSQHWTTGWWQGDNDGDDCSNIGPGKEEEESIWNEAAPLSIKDSKKTASQPSTSTCFFQNVIFLTLLHQKTGQLPSKLSILLSVPTSSGKDSKAQLDFNIKSEQNWKSTGRKLLGNCSLSMLSEATSAWLPVWWLT